MQVKILKKKKNSIEFLLEGEDHSFANLLSKTLHEIEHVTFAAYNIAHPLTDRGKPVLVVKTDGKITPKKAVIEASKRIKKEVHEFRKKLK
ncbi:MAG: DNA-directed RNA polymerase subunit L [Candidatus Methanofastidiosia archaeon]